MVEYILKYKESVELKNNITITNKSNRDIKVTSVNNELFIEIEGCNIPLALSWVRDNDEISVIDRNNRWACPLDDKSSKVTIYYNIKNAYSAEYLVERIKEVCVTTKVIVE